MDEENGQRESRGKNSAPQQAKSLLSRRHVQRVNSLQGAVCEEDWGEKTIASPHRKLGIFLTELGCHWCVRPNTYRSLACKSGPAVSYRICNKTMRSITPTRTKKASLFACFTKWARVVRGPH